MEEKFSKFFIASLKRTAQNVSPMLRRKAKIEAEIQKLSGELNSVIETISSYDAPIRQVTGYGVVDLVERFVEATDKVDKDGNPVKNTKWVLKYPDTIIPPVAEPVVKDCGENENAAPVAEENSENTESFSF